jgi:hypothetical protein
MQSCRRSTIAFFPQESWDFIVNRFYPIIHPVPFCKSQTKPHQFCNLSLVTKTTVVSNIMLRIADEDGIQAACKLFGRTFGIGCRNIPPHNGHDVRKLLYGDIINLVNVISAENQQARGSARFKEFIVAQGVEFVFEVQRGPLSIRVRYSSHKAESPQVQNILCIQQRIEAPLLSASSISSSNRPIAIGTNFLLQGGLVVVIRCESKAVVVHGDQTGIEESLDVDIARNLIRRYILGN